MYVLPDALLRLSPKAGCVLGAMYRIAFFSLGMVLLAGLESIAAFFILSVLEILLGTLGLLSVYKESLVRVYRIAYLVEMVALPVLLGGLFLANLLFTLAYELTVARVVLDNFPMLVLVLDFVIKLFFYNRTWAHEAALRRQVPTL